MTRVQKFKRCTFCLELKLARPGQNSCEDCDKELKALYSKPLNAVKMRNCRGCGQLSHNYYYCNDCLHPSQRETDHIYDELMPMAGHVSLSEISDEFAYMNGFCVLPDETLEGPAA